MNKVILGISARNLFRQKRRNILLGTAIAFGMMILVVANSFSHGISDTLLNKIVVYVAGHIDVVFIEDGKIRFPVMRDKDRFLKLINDNVKGIDRVEESLALFTRGIGVGKSDNIAVIGVKPDKEFYGFLNVQSGKAEDLESSAYENPVVVSSEKAKSLNVKVHDVIRIRFQNIYGQQQTGTLTVAAIAKSQNMFMDMAIFINRPNAKKLMGYKPSETGSLQIILKDPTSAVKQADLLHELLTPSVAEIYGDLESNGQTAGVTALTFSDDAVADGQATKNIQLLQGSRDEAANKEGLLISDKLAQKLLLRAGDKVSYSYRNKDEGLTVTNNYKVTGIFRSSAALPGNIMILGRKLFYKTYYRDVPEKVSLYAGAFVPATGNVMYAAFGKEWKLVDRSRSSDDFTKKLKTILNRKSSEAMLDVRTMYETASSVLKMEKVLNLITLIAVMILFFIILIGVINTLRMTIRERTREIGTVRAIGMQKADVRNMFILETLMLAFISSLVGIVFAFAAMWLLGLITIDTQNALNILLVEKHLHFVPSIKSILLNLLLILGIAVATAFFPARRAANLSAATALRHYE